MDLDGTFWIVVRRGWGEVVKVEHLQQRVEPPYGHFVLYVRCMYVPIVGQKRLSNMAHQQSAKVRL